MSIQDSKFRLDIQAGPIIQLRQIPSKKTKLAVFSALHKVRPKTRVPGYSIIEGTHGMYHRLRTPREEIAFTDACYSAWDNEFIFLDQLWRLSDSGKLENKREKGKHGMYMGS